MNDDVWDTPHSKRWIESVLTNMAPKLRDSAMTVSIAPTPSGDGDEGDVKFWVELGASIMYDKPILVVAFHDQKLPERLERVADEVVRCENGVSPESSELVAEAISRMMGKSE